MSHRFASVVALILILALLAPAGHASAPTGLGDVPEASGYTLIYDFDIPRSTNSLNSGITYATDNSSTFAGPFDRIAYYLELQNGSGTRWIWVSVEAFTDNVKKIGIPGAAAAILWQRPVFGMNVYSSEPGIIEGTGIDTGIIEFWPSGYSAGNEMAMPYASETVNDWGDGGANFGSGYGSMQLHNYDVDGSGPGTAGQTLFAYNGWGQAGFGDDLGIGNAPSGNPDWTLVGGSRDYDARRLKVFVRSSPVKLTAFPEYRQVLGRDVATDRAAAQVGGLVIQAGYDAAQLRVYREGVLVQTLTQPLTYTASEAPFAFTPEITAELANYDLELSLRAGGIERHVRTARSVVAGDIYIIQGQSNAVANMYSGDGNVNRSEFLRSYGTAATDASGIPTTNDRTWHVANANTANVSGSIGQWGARFGRRVIDATGIPVAIFNGAHGGQPIGFFQRNDANPTDLSTNYGRLLARLQASGSAGKVRGVFWHQGESDVDNAAGHESGWTALHADWLVDYPSTEETYNHQVRDGCGPPSIQLRDVQRRFQDTIPDVTAMSTTGLDGHDGCHYAYEEGYKLIGDHLAEVVLRDLYGRPDGGNLLPPNPQAAFWGNPARTEVVVVMRSFQDGLIWEADAEADTHLVGSAAVPTSVVSDGNTLRITLSGDGAGASGVTYDGHSGAGPWITNTRGVGLLEFYNIPITLAPAAKRADASITAVTGGVALAWQPDYANCAYEVHRSESPYFALSTETQLLPVLPAGTAGREDGDSATGNPQLNHFYQLRSNNCDGASSAISEGVGEFDFALTAGAAPP